MKLTNLISKAFGQVQQPKCETAKELLQNVQCGVTFEELAKESPTLQDKPLSKFQIVYDPITGYRTTETQPTIELIKQWIHARNLQTQDARIQMCKVVEELGELANAINKGNIEGQKDGIGDTIVTLICISEQLGLNFYECLEIAYNEIKHRKGKLINGMFVKNADIK